MQTGQKKNRNRKQLGSHRPREDGTGEDGKLNAQNVVDVKVIKLQRDVPIQWSGT